MDHAPTRIGFPLPRLCALLALALFLAPALNAQTFRVAAYNLENYLEQPTKSRPHAKSPEARAKIRESIRALHPDVIALEEMGTTNALLELRDSLKADGLDLPFWEHVSGYDTNINVAVLSRFPFTARRPHTNEDFLLNGRRFEVSRGFAEVDIQVSAAFSFTLIAAHLKSKRPGLNADEGDERLEEAKILRRLVDTRLTADPGLNLVVLGDFNDTQDSPAIKTLIGRGRNKLVDTRPAERNGDNAPPEDSRWEPRNVTWTHYYGIEDSYARIDYILLSPAMARTWVSSGTYVLSLANWGVGSDHRPLVAEFTVGREAR
jgi:endonuclease/exonuclease/phosphatase family metal-dependent hydrolase